MKLIDAKGNRVRLKENEKVIPESRVEQNESEKQNIWLEPELQYLADEDYALPENCCGVEFTCCELVGQSCAHKSSQACEHYYAEKCTSKIAQVQAMYRKIKELVGE